MPSAQPARFNAPAAGGAQVAKGARHFDRVHAVRADFAARNRTSRRNRTLAWPGAVVAAGRPGEFVPAFGHRGGGRSGGGIGGGGRGGGGRGGGGRGGGGRHNHTALGWHGLGGGGIGGTAHNRSMARRIALHVPACPTHAGAARRDPKAYTRHRVCLERSRALDERAEAPLLWSRAHVAAQESFVNENPFAARKFGRFMRLLPERSNLSEIGRGWTRAALCDPCDTCAVVGASGSLLNYAHGPLIDAHQLVIRPNWLVLKGFEKHTGTRTSANLIFGVEGMMEQFHQSQKALPASERAVGLVTSGSDRSVASFFRYLGRIKTNSTRQISAFYLLSDAIYLRAMGALCNATEQGCSWARRTSTMRPSTGFMAVMAARATCRKVSLFGLTDDPCRPFHYYGTPKPECTTAIPKKNDESLHWFEKEHAIYAEWQRAGVLTVYS